MNSTTMNSTCILEERVYTSTYLFFKIFYMTYLRLLIGPGILLNTLCLLVLSRPRLCTKSTTIIFLRFLALFDIFAITLKYLRAEINYQSTEKGRQVFMLTSFICKTLYIFMNSCISVSMWTIVLMSLDKAVAVMYPLKSNIWLTHKRVFYICCCTVLALFLVNLSVIELSDILLDKHSRKYCGLSESSIVLDLLTASILPMALITAANIVIAVILRRVSRTSINRQSTESQDRRESDSITGHSRLSIRLDRFRPSNLPVSTAEITSATRRRTSTQVTRMLLAVTLSLIVCNIPNTIYFVVVKFYDTRKLLYGRSCMEVKDDDIKMYKIGFYFVVIQDVLSDLPHIVNFFLYCLAGKKFRSIFINEVRHFLYELHLIKRKDRRYTHTTCGMKSELPSRSHVLLKRERAFSDIPKSRTRRTMEVLFNGTTSKTFLNEDNHNLLQRKNFPRTSIDERHLRPYRNLQ